MSASHLWGISRLFEAEGYSLLYDLQQGSLCRWVFTQLVCSLTHTRTMIDASGTSTISS